LALPDIIVDAAQGNALSYTYVANLPGITSSADNTLSGFIQVALPSAEIVSETGRSFCEGDSLPLSVFSRDSLVAFEWSSGQTGDSIRYGAAATASVVVSDTNGCQASDTFEVTRFELPDAGFTSTVENQAVDVVAKDRTLEAFTWSFGDGQFATGERARNVYAQQGEFTITLEATTVAGCVDSSSQTINIVATGIADWLAETDFAVYPNPFEGKAQIGFSLNRPQKVMIRLVNANGQMVGMVHDSRLSAGRHQLSLNGSALPAGYYFLQVQMGGRSAVMQLQRRR
jgi:hypothetical protein